MLRWRSYLLLCLVLLSVVGLAVSVQDPCLPPSHPEFMDDFNPSPAPSWSGYSLGKHTADPPETPLTSPNVVIVDAPGRAGEKAWQLTILSDDYTSAADASANKERAELWRHPALGEQVLGSEIWYAYSLLIPADYDYTLNDGAGKFQITGQWHDNGAGAGLEPPVSVAYRQTGPGGVSTLRLRYGPEDAAQTYGDITVERGVWHDLEFHFRLSKSFDGFARMYIDGAFAVEFSGPNVYRSQPDNAPNQFRLGIYRGFAQTIANTLYFGRVRIAKTRARLNLPGAG